MGMRQIGEQELGEPKGFATLATIRAGRAELEACGIELQAPEFDGSWDEAGPVEEALLELDSGEQAILIWHLALEQHPEHYRAAPLELRAPLQTPSPRAFADAVLAELGLPCERLEWLVEERYWPPAAPGGEGALTPGNGLWPKRVGNGPPQSQSR